MNLLKLEALGERLKFSWRMRAINEGSFYPVIITNSLNKAGKTNYTVITFSQTLESNIS